MSSSGCGAASEVGVAAASNLRQLGGCAVVGPDGEAVYSCAPAAPRRAHVGGPQRWAPPWPLVALLRWARQRAELES